MAEPVPLGDQVTQVVRGGDYWERHAADHVDAESGQAAHLRRVVGEQPDRPHPEIAEDLRARAVLARVGGQAELKVGVDRIGARVLQLVGLQLAEQADAAALVTAKVEHDAAALGRDRRHRRVQLRTAVTALRLRKHRR